MSLATLGLALLAGLLSTLSPCVLPLLPLVVGAALAAHRFGALVLAVGLVLSYTVFGVLLATVGLSLGIRVSALQNVGAVFLLLFGVILLVPALQDRFTQWTARFAHAAAQRSSRIPDTGLSGQFALGLLLGAVWSPCVGPTLGAAITLASRGEDLLQVAVTMALFGLGAALPLVLIGWVSRQGFLRWRGNLLRFAAVGKRALGVLFIGLGIGILTGLNHTLDIWLLQHSPEWLTALTTRF